jgi:hypothetical protein
MGEGEELGRTVHVLNNKRHHIKEDVQEEQEPFRQLKFLTFVLFGFTSVWI